MHAPVCLTEDEVMQLFEKDRAGIAAAVNSLCGNPHLTEEIVQETHIAVFHQWREFDPEKASFKTWATGIAMNKTFTAFSERNREQSMLQGLLAHTMLYATEKAASEVDLERQYRALQFCVRRLNGFQKRLFNLRLVQARAYVDIAALTGRSPGAVRVVLHRLKVLLFECVRRRLSEDDTC